MKLSINNSSPINLLILSSIGIAIEDKISNVIGLLLLIVNFIIFKIV